MSDQSARLVSGRFGAYLLAVVIGGVSVWLSTSFPEAQNAETYDVVFRSGRVVDPESGLDAVRNVGITGKKIAAVSSQPLTGKLEIDASGLVVSPGFIDLHSHGQSPEAYRYKAMDGVTTARLLRAHGQWPTSATVRTGRQ